MDSERGRDSRRKKYSSRDKDKDKEPAKRMVILTKSKEGKPEEPPPTIILKTRDSERAVSPLAAASSSKPLTKEAESAQLPYQLASRAVPQVVPTVHQMKDSLKFLDGDTLTINDGLLEYLGDSSDFLVVGCIGLQGVGKSSIMSHLANPASIDDPDLMVFKSQTQAQVDTNSHCTEGVNCYMTNQRVILLDTQPILSLSVLSKYYSSDGAGLAVRSCHRDDPDYPSLENDVETLFLQYVAFILSVCHVVIVVQDYCHDLDLIRFLLTAEMFKPPSSVHADEEIHDHFPHLVLAHNQCTQRMFSNLKVRDIQESYKAMFSCSQLPIQSGMGIADGIFMPSLSPELCDVDPINLYLIPQRGRPDRPPLYEVKEYGEIIELMRGQIFGATAMPLTHATLSEKNWLHYAVKMWEDIKKSTVFAEYARMLPTSSSYQSEQ